MVKGMMQVSTMHAFIVTSSYAVKVDPVSRKGTVLEADAQGNISAGTGDVLYFRHYKKDKYIPINELLVHAGSQNVKLQLNDNARYIWTIPAGESSGISGMDVYYMKILEDCTFRYEGLAD